MEAVYKNYDRICDLKIPLLKNVVAMSPVCVNAAPLPPNGTKEQSHSGKTTTPISTYYCTIFHLFCQVFLD
jgi:hypothetical protein